MVGVLKVIITPRYVGVEKDIHVGAHTYYHPTPCSYWHIPAIPMNPYLSTHPLYYSECK